MSGLEAGVPGARGPRVKISLKKRSNLHTPTRPRPPSTRRARTPNCSIFGHPRCGRWENDLHHIRYLIGLGARSRVDADPYT